MYLNSGPNILSFIRAKKKLSPNVDWGNVSAYIQESNKKSIPVFGRNGHFLLKNCSCSCENRLKLNETCNGYGTSESPQYLQDTSQSVGRIHGLSVLTSFMAR